MAEEHETRETKTRVAVAIQKGRDAKGLSQAELASAARCSVETISNAERKASLPGLALFLEIARILEIDVASLVDATKDRRRLSKSRAAQEAEVQRLITTLDDRHLGYLVVLGQAFDTG